MNKEFLQEIFDKHQHTETYPSTSSICRLMTRIILILFPEQTKKHYHEFSDIENALTRLEDDLYLILKSMQHNLPRDAKVIASEFMNQLPEVYYLLKTDVEATMLGDPAAKSEFEVIRTYPGFYTMGFYRLANRLHNLEVPLLPRALMEYAHSRTGIDIHPGATIDSHLFIDHGTGIVIGETAMIGKHVKIYQCVTLGALSVRKDMASKKRHPTIEDRVVIYSGATILGGDTVIGRDCVIGGNVWLTNSLPPQTKIYHQEQVKIIDNA